MVKLNEPERFPTHRFIDWFEGKHFAFARGLAVNPTHLPLALDAMLIEGWELVDCFGKPLANEMGFIFRRKENDCV